MRGGEPAAAWWCRFPSDRPAGSLILRRRPCAARRVMRRPRWPSARTPSSSRARDNVLRVYGPGDEQRNTALSISAPSSDWRRMVRRRTSRGDPDRRCRLLDHVSWSRQEGRRDRAVPAVATQLEIVNGRVKVTPVGKPYDDGSGTLPSIPCCKRMTSKPRQGGRPSVHRP